MSRRALVERVLPQPVDHLHHALVVGVELLGAACRARPAARSWRWPRSRPSCCAARTERDQRVELGRVARAVLRVGQRPACTALARVRLDLGAPRRRRTARRWRSSPRWRRPCTGSARRRLGVGDRHHLGDAADVDLQRVDAQVGQLAARRPATRSAPRCRAPCRRALAHQAGAAQAHQRMQARCAPPPKRRVSALGIFGADHAVVAQPLQQQAPVERGRVRGAARGGRAAGAWSGSTARGGCGASGALGTSGRTSWSWSASSRRRQRPHHAQPLARRQAEREFRCYPHARQARRGRAHHAASRRSTTVLPSRVGRRLQTWSAPKAAAMRARAALRSWRRGRTG